MGGLGELFLHERPGPRRLWGLAAEAQSGFSAVAALSSLPRPQQGVYTSACVCVFCLVAPSRPGRALHQPLRPGKAAARFCVGQEAAGGSVLLPRCSPPQLGAAGCGCTALSSQAVRWDPEKLSPVGAFVQKFEGEQDSSSLVGFLLKGLAEFSKPRSEVRLVHGW